MVVRRVRWVGFGAAMLMVTWVRGSPAIASPAVVIDFQQVFGLGNPTFGIVRTQGYTFTSLHAHVVGEPDICSFEGCVAPPTYIAEEGGGGGQPISMNRTRGGSFQLLSVEGAQDFNNDQQAADGGYPNAIVLHVVGVLTNGQTIGADFMLPDTGFEAFVFPANTCRLSTCRFTSVTFSGVTDQGDSGAIAVDNITVR